jgi:simple sugar transport system permease protein
MKNLLPSLHSAIYIMTPLLLAATGGLFTELAGTINIALEGLLLIGAFSAITTVYFTGSFSAGLVAAILASMLLAALLAGTSIKLRSNVFITGLAVNLLASGLTIVLSHYIFNTRGVVALKDISHLPIIIVPFIDNIPVIGTLLSGHSTYVYASWLLLFLSWIAIYKTPFGYRLRACDKQSDALVSFGINPDTYRWIGFLVSGLFCGIGGSFLSLNLGAFVPNMTAGKGWVALVVIFLGVRKPLGLFAAAFVYGLAEAFSNHAQGLFNIPADFVLAMPYLLAFIAMILVSVWVKQKK